MSPTPNLSTAWGAGGAPHMRRSGPALTLGRHSPLPCALHSNLLLMWVVISQVNYFHLYIYSGAPNQIIQTVFSWQCSCDQQSWFLWIAQLQKCSKSNSFTGLKDLILGGASYHCTHKTHPHHIWLLKFMFLIANIFLFSELHELEIFPHYIYNGEILPRKTSNFKLF